MNTPRIFCLAFLAVALSAGAGAQQTELYKLYASDASGQQLFGSGVAIDGSLAIVGASLDEHPDWGMGAAYVLRRSLGLWTEEQKLVASDAFLGDRFGSSVAIAGDVAVVGAPVADSREGAVYVFRFDGSSWVEEQRLSDSTTAVERRFGISVATDGDVVVVGAHLDNQVDPSDSQCMSGATYVYRFDGAQWLLEEKLRPVDLACGDGFGISVAVDDVRIAVGAMWSDAAAENAGAAYVYRYDGSAWIQEQRLTASDADSFDHLGQSVDLDDQVVVAGAWTDEDAGTYSGSAYVFRRVSGQWIQEQKLVASDAAAHDKFGESVSVSGAAIVVATRHNDHSGTFNRGAAYPYRFDGGVWTEGPKLVASDALQVHEFASAVCVDGPTIFVAAELDPSLFLFGGSVYVFATDEPCAGLATPFDLTAAPVSPTTIRLEWQGDSTDVGVFNVERAFSQSGPFHLIAQVGAGAVPGIHSFAHEDPAVAPGVPVCYRISAQHVDGRWGCPSEVVCSITTDDFRRGDVNGDRWIDGLDGKWIWSFLYRGTPLKCLDAADVDDSGSIDKRDVAYLEAFLYEKGPAPPPPFREPGVDPTVDKLDCAWEGREDPRLR